MPFIFVIVASKLNSVERDLLARYGQAYGISPYDPIATKILGEKMYSSLSAIPDKVDIVQVFRKSEDVPLVVWMLLSRSVRKSYECRSAYFTTEPCDITNDLAPPISPASVRALC